MGAQVAVDRQKLEDNGDPAWNICEENVSVVFVQIQVNLLLSAKCVLLNWVYQGGSCFVIHPLMPEGLIFLWKSLLLTLLGSALRSGRCLSSGCCSRVTFPHPPLSPGHKEVSRGSCWEITWRRASEAMVATWPRAG